VTFRSWLGKQIRELAAEPEIPVAPPTPSPESPPSSPTLNGRTTPATSEEPAVSLQLVQMLGEMQKETMREVRQMVVDILQGREQPPLSEQDQASVSRTRFDPPDYDAPGTDDLPLGIQGIFHRQDMEEVEFRTSHSEPELLRNQLERARAVAGMDPQGPSAAPSFSTGSIGLQPEDLDFQ
jgi:hypothetical protein